MCAPACVCGCGFDTLSFRISCDRGEERNQKGSAGQDRAMEQTAQKNLGADGTLDQIFSLYLQTKPNQVEARSRKRKEARETSTCSYICDLQRNQKGCFPEDLSPQVVDGGWCVRQGSGWMKEFRFWINPLSPQLYLHFSTLNWRL